MPAKVSAFHFIAVCFLRGPSYACVFLRRTTTVRRAEDESEEGTRCACTRAGDGACTHFLRASLPSWVAFQCVRSRVCACVCLVSQVGTLRQEKRDTELGGLARPSAIINYLQVLQNNNTKKCEPSISPPFTRNQYQYLMQCGWKMSRDMGA